MYNPFKKLAAFFVRRYAERLYSQAKERADLRHLTEQKIIYVIISPFDKKERQLIVCDGDEFRQMKHGVGMKKKQMPVPVVRQRFAVYHTPDKFGQCDMTEKEIAVKKEAFIQRVLMKAKLA